MWNTVRDLGKRRSLEGLRGNISRTAPPPGGTVPGGYGAGAAPSSKGGSLRARPLPGPPPAAIPGKPISGRYNPVVSKYLIISKKTKIGQRN